MSVLNYAEYKCFEEIKHLRSDGGEYWEARELAPVLEYVKWENFSKVINRAMLACQNSGFVVSDHFAEVSKTIKMPKSAKKQVIDFELSRYACCLIVQNDDPRKEIIALGQTYFAIQTYRQEITDRINQLDEDSKRLIIHGDIKQWNKMLSEATYNAMDAELIANLFHMSQTEEKLERDAVINSDTATAIHHSVGQEVRAAIEHVGGTMPEGLLTSEESIAEIEKERIKALKKKGNQLMLDE